MYIIDENTPRAIPLNPRKLFTFPGVANVKFMTTALTFKEQALIIILETSVKKRIKVFQCKRKTGQKRQEKHAAVIKSISMAAHEISLCWNMVAARGDLRTQ